MRKSSNIQAFDEEEDITSERENSSYDLVPFTSSPTCFQSTTSAVLQDWRSSPP